MADSSSNPWYTRFVVSIWIAGFFSFACIASEYYYMVMSFWRQSYHIMFMFFGWSIIMMCLVAALVSILYTYTTLNYGNYHWWWRAYFNGFMVGPYLFGLTYYFIYSYDVPMDWGSAFVFTIMTVVLCAGISLIAGAASFLGSFHFN